MFSKKKKKKVFTKIETDFSAGFTFRLVGGDASRNGAELFEIEADFSAIIVTFRLVGGMHPPIPPLNPPLSVACCVRYSTCSRAAEAGFLNQWAIGDFAVDHRVIRKIGCLVQKSLISVISIGEFTKIEDFDALTFFSDTGENCSPRGEDLFFRRSGQKLVFQRGFFEIRAKIALPKVKTFFF